MFDELSLRNLPVEDIRFLSSSCFGVMKYGVLVPLLCPEYEADEIRVI